MPHRLPASRDRFRDYLRDLKARRRKQRADSGSPETSTPTRHGSRIRSGSRTRTSRELTSAFYRLLGRQRKSVAFALGTLTVATLLNLVPPAATKFVVDSVLGDAPLPVDSVFGFELPTDRWNLLILICVGMLCVSVLGTAINIWGRWTATQATKRLQLSVRKRVFEHAVRLPLHRVQELRSGGVASILRNDASSVGELIFGMVYNPWRALIQLVGSLLILLWVDWRLLLGAMILLPIVFVTHRLWITRIRPQHRDIRGTREEIDSHATESFGGMRVVRAFSRQHRESGRFMGNNNLLARQELHTWWWMRSIELTWDLLIPVATTAMLLYSGWQVLEGRLSIGDVMMFTVYCLMLLEPIAILAQSATAFQNSLSGLDRVLDLLEEPREMTTDETPDALDRADVRGRITFEAVSFQYPGATREALRDVSFEAAPGQKVALVGASGAGKTTLCNLVARFYDPTDGVVSLDGEPLATHDVEQYRSLLGIVEQDIFLFDGTISENIGYGRPDATDAEIAAAARVANAHDFITEFDDGYETIIGERGVKLSGGQRQRLAIARAVLADPKVLILDEATSNLDTQSERLIQEGMDRLRENRTCFVIAHRLSTITHADLILVLEDGQIIERGTHEELLAGDGRYAEMVRLQLEPADRDRRLPEHML